MQDRKQEKSKLDTRRDDLETAKNYGTHFWEVFFFVKGSPTRCEAVKMEPASKHLREIQQKTRKIRSRSVSALSPHDDLFQSV